MPSKPTPAEALMRDTLDDLVVESATAERKRISEILWGIAERMRNDNIHGCHAMMVAIEEIEPK